jgi:hypothetical protein
MGELRLAFPSNGRRRPGSYDVPFRVVGVGKTDGSAMPRKCRIVDV